ncbi:MAG: M48 family metallopeptidase [Rhizobiales bacterium]|nr:M48 family metallopeptidase [Hyphomicrobiales bacterium]
MLRLFRRDAPRVADTRYFDIALDEGVARVAVKRSATARRFTLRVRAATRDVVLTIPKRGSLAAARDFVERHAAWIGARLKRLPQPVPFAPGETIPVRGEDHLIVHRPLLRGTVWTVTREDGTRLLCVAGGGEHVSRRVADFLRREARRDLEAAVARHTTTLGLKARSVSLRDTTSRWGSCSATGALNFSWRLIFAPSLVLDYLAAHEVAHLAHLDHSPRFWAVTRRLAPETDRAEAWLAAHGASLHRYGPGARALAAAPRVDDEPAPVDKARRVA